MTETITNDQAGLELTIEELDAIEAAALEAQRELPGEWRCHEEEAGEMTCLGMADSEDSRGSFMEAWGGCTEWVAAQGFIEKAQPSVVLKLVAQARSPEAKRDMERQERQLGETIDQRDAAEEALSQAYYLLTGRSPEWSSIFGHKDALEEMEAWIDQLKEAARPPPKPTL